VELLSWAAQLPPVCVSAFYTRVSSVPATILDPLTHHHYAITNELWYQQQQTLSPFARQCYSTLLWWPVFVQVTQFFLPKSIGMILAPLPIYS